MNNLNENRNILHVINIYFSLSYFGDQFKYFSQKGYKQHVICSPAAQLKEYSEEQGIEFEEVGISRKITLLADIYAIFKIARYIQKNKIDVIVGQTPKGALLAMIAGYIMRVPKRIYYRHGLVYETMTGFKRRMMIFLDRLTSLCSTKIVVVSDYLYKRSIDDKLNKASKQLILGKGTCGGIDSNNKFNPELINSKTQNALRKSLGIETNDFVIGFCGRLVKDKGIVELVDSFHILKNAHSNRKLKLLLVGGYEERDILPSSTIQKIENNPNIICTGFIYENIEYYYSLMSLFILPSYREGFGMALIEASAMEIPVLGTNHTGSKDALIDNKTGFYISNSVDSILNGINKILEHSNPSLLGKEGRRFVVSNFDNLVLWPKIESELYSKN